MLTKFWTIGVVAILILFQPEFRQVLARMGQRPFLRPFLLEEKFINEVVDSVFSLARAKLGAIIIFERNTGLQDYVKTGVELDSEYTRELIETIFSPNTPLHDGAVIIKNKRVAAAGCLLPLTDKTGLDRIYGTRHRAGLGLSEETDALAIVVSEETGNISIIISGKITPNLNEELLREMLIMHGS
jgi:diadenylate cyclase